MSFSIYTLIYLETVSSITIRELRENIVLTTTFLTIIKFKYLQLILENNNTKVVLNTIKI